MTAVARPASLLSLIAACVLAAVGCTSDSPGDAGPRYDAARQVPVALGGSGSTSRVDGTVRLGVLVSTASAPGEGAEWADQAAGARVAEYRYRQGGVKVQLEVVDDHGLSAGAVAAIDDLVKSGASGLVAATSGPHLDAALRRAAAASLPVVLPYEPRTVPGASTSWLTGPTTAATAAALRTLVDQQSFSRPFVLAGEGAEAEVAGLAPAGLTARVRAGAAPVDAVRPVVAAARARRIDGVVLAASAETQAVLLAELQGAAPDLPVVLTPHAVAARFGQSLDERLLADGAATTAGRFFTVGTAAQDATAAGSSPEAAPLASYLAALRLAAQDSDVDALLHAVPFAEEGAATADVASHDAVVALVRAVQTAGSTDRAAVRTALSTLSLDAGDGLAGPALDLHALTALPAAAVVPLQATTQDPGQRTGVRQARVPLTWFALPTDRG